MAYLFNGTTSKLVLAQTVVTAAPLTLACFFKPAVISGTQRLIEIGEITGVNAFLLAMTAGAIQAFTTATTNQNAATTETAVTNTWQSAAMVSQAATLRYAVYNGRFSVSNIVSRIPAGVNMTSIGVSSSGAVQFWSGLLAEVAMWSAALTPRELQSYNDGKSAELIRPENLLLYMPMTTQAGINDLGPQQLVFTNTACVSVSDHPSIYRSDAKGARFQRKLRTRQSGIG